MRVVVVPYSEQWPAQFAEVRTELLAAFSPLSIAVEHIGSTSIQGLAAKPIIDVLLGAESLFTVEVAMAALAQRGYEYVAKYEHEFPNRRYFVKAASNCFPRVNLHSVVQGSVFWREHLQFRNALRSSPTLLSQYQELKLRLAAEFPNDRPAYTAAKAPFIQAVLCATQLPAIREG